MIITTKDGSKTIIDDSQVEDILFEFGDERVEALIYRIHASGVHIRMVDTLRIVPKSDTSIHIQLG